MKNIFKKAVIASALAVNAVGAYNSSILSFRVMDDLPSDFHDRLGVTGGLTLLAPVTNYMNWKHGDDPSYDFHGATPVTSISNVFHHHTHSAIDQTANAIFTAVSLPGSIVGSAVGGLTGYFFPHEHKAPPSHSMS